MSRTIARGLRDKVIASAVLATIPAFTSPALGACQQSGSNVDCTGSFNTGFGTGTENNLTVTVQPSAAMTVNANAFGINVSNGNSVVNNGSMTMLGPNSIGFQGIAGNSFTNNGTMTLGTSSVAAFSFGGNSNFSNNGTISSTAQGVNGFNVMGTGNTMTNSGTINLSGTGSYGLVALGGGNNTVLNTGTIIVGNGATGTNGTGIWIESSSSFTNSGTVKAAGDNGVGVTIGTNNTVTNNGLITATGAYGIAIGISDVSNKVVNNGTLTGGPNGYSLFSWGTLANTITNNGTMDGQMYFLGTGNTLINSGLITISNPATLLNAAAYSFAGTFTQTASGTLAFRVDNNGQHDGMYAEKANLNGTLRATVLPGLFGGPITYSKVIDTSGGVSGQFSDVTTGLAFINASATYQSNSVDLTLTRVGFGSVAGETLNQRAVGNALEAGYATTLTGPAATFYTRLLQASSVGALDRLSGEGSSATQNTAFGMAGLFGQTIDGQMAAWRAGGGGTGNTPLGYAAEAPAAAEQAFAMLKAPALVPPQWSIWAGGFGASQSLSGNAVVGSADFSSRTAGGALGVNYIANPDLLLGVAAGASTATYNVADRAASGRLDAAYVTGYAMQKFGAGYVSAQLGYSHFDNNTTRIISGIGPDETARGAFGSQLVGGRLEIGRSFDFGTVVATPFAAVQASRLWQPGYTETSTAGAAPGLLGLNYAAQSVNSLPVFLGSQFDAQYNFGNGMIWAPFLRAAWVHEFSPSRAITASLTTVPAPAWTVEGARAAADAGRVDLGSRLVINRWIELSSRFTGEFSRSGQTYAGSGALKVSW